MVSLYVDHPSSLPQRTRSRGRPIPPSTAGGCPVCGGARVNDLTSVSNGDGNAIDDQRTRGDTRRTQSCGGMPWSMDAPFASHPEGCKSRQYPDLWKFPATLGSPGVATGTLIINGVPSPLLTLVNQLTRARHKLGTTSTFDGGIGPAPPERVR